MATDNDVNEIESLNHFDKVFCATSSATLWCLKYFFLFTFLKSSNNHGYWFHIMSETLCKQSEKF